jgi:predicted deacetylase
MKEKLLLPRPAQYLLRFDDLCPTLSLDRWQRFVPLFEEFLLQPILAVVPDNRDAQLERGPVDPEFWNRMKALEDAGATIALHGYQHLCTSAGRSLVPLHRHSEFAGVPLDTQRDWIQTGLSILRDHGLNPRVWVAPRHGFDRNTLLALRQEGIKLLSDGLARVPFVRDGLTWIPQQLWSPVEKPAGLWTICIHPNSAQGSQVNRLRAFLNRYAAQFTSVNRIVSELEPAQLGLSDRCYEIAMQWKKCRKRRQQRRSG